MTPILLALPFLGALLSRISGGMKPTLPGKLAQCLYSLLYFAAPLCLGFAWPWSVLAGGMAFVGKITGHGQYMDLGSWLLKTSPERVDFIVKWIFGDDPNVTQTTILQPGNYWRDFFGLAVTGMLCAFGLFLALCFHGLFVPAFVVLAGGAAKSLAYDAGWKSGGFSLIKTLDKPTELGEALTGFFGWGSIILAALWS